MKEEQEQTTINNRDTKDLGSQPPESDYDRNGITNEDLSDFIFNNGAKYITKFKKFYSNGGDKFALTWHWPVFFLSFIWLAYRKLYGWAIIAFLLSFVPLLNYIIRIPLGLSANYLYYRNVQKKILGYNESNPSSGSIQRADELRKIGGVNAGAAFLFILVGAILGFLLYRLGVSL